MRIVLTAALAATLVLGPQPAASAQKASPEVQAAAEICLGKRAAATWTALVASCSTVLKENVKPDVKAAAHFNRGSGWLRLGDSARALADLDASLKIAPKFARALVSRASIHLSRNKLDLAAADLDRAIALDPKSSVAYNNRALVWMGRKQPDKAVADFTKAIELDPKDPVSWAARGTASLTSGKKDQALEDFNKALALDPANMVALFNRGVLFAATGDKPRARADFEAVLARDPRNENARNQIAELDKPKG